MEPISAGTLILWVIGILGATALGAKIRAWRASRGELSASPGSSSSSDSSTLPAGNATEAGACKTTVPVAARSVDKPYPGTKAVPGRASIGTYQWIYTVKKGETPGSIAKEITGDARRYVEILSANSDRRMVTYRVGSGSSSRVEVNFAASDFCAGDDIYVPKSMNPWIDEAGNFAYSDAGLSHAFAPYDVLASYPVIDGTGITAGFSPWPPSAPTGWGAIPLPSLPKAGT